MKEERAIVRTDEFGSYEIWFPDQKDNNYRFCVYAAVPCYKVRRLHNHFHSVTSLDYYQTKSKPVRRPLAQAVLNLYEKQYGCVGEHRLVMRWPSR